MNESNSSEANNEREVNSVTGNEAGAFSDAGLDAAAMAAMAEEVRQANERALRAQAELENFRKRIRRDMDEQLRYAALPILRDLLPVIDNLERAIKSAEAAPGSTGLLDGVKMVVDHFVMVMQQHHCRRIDAAGTQFDPNIHEAIAQEPSTELAAGMVTRVTQMGYQLHDRVIRPSLVMVSTGAPTESSNASTQSA